MKVCDLLEEMLDANWPIVGFVFRRGFPALSLVKGHHIIHPGLSVSRLMSE